MVLIPAREHATNNAQTHFVTAKTWESRALFRAELWAKLFFQNLLAHRDSYLLHEFVLMPDHFHLLISPSIPLERAAQFIKGGFSYRAKKELGSNAEIWQRGFSDHRIRDIEDCQRHVQYIHLNPVKKHLCNLPGEYRYSSAYPGWKLDPIPPGLKPAGIGVDIGGTAEAVPFQSEPFLSSTYGSQGAEAEATPFQSEAFLSSTDSSQDAEIGATPFQSEALLNSTDGSEGAEGNATPIQSVSRFQSEKSFHECGLEPVLVMFQDHKKSE